MIEAENEPVGAVLAGLVTPEMVTVPMVATVWLIKTRITWVSDAYVEFNLPQGMSRAATRQRMTL